MQQAVKGALPQSGKKGPQTDTIREPPYTSNSMYRRPPTICWVNVQALLCIPASPEVAEQFATKLVSASLVHMVLEAMAFFPSVSKTKIRST